MSTVDTRPRAYDIDNSNDMARLFRECEGYLRTCKRHHHGTDFEGREFAMKALAELWDRNALREAALKTAQGTGE